MVDETSMDRYTRVCAGVYNIWCGYLFAEFKVIKKEIHTIELG